MGHLYSQNFFNVLSPRDSFTTLTLSFCQNGSPQTVNHLNVAISAKAQRGEELHLARPKLLNHFYRPSLRSLAAPAVSASANRNPVSLPSPLCRISFVTAQTYLADVLKCRGPRADNPASAGAAGCSSQRGTI
ncbi:hypothetical protein QQF64_002204 [Cirrhinus molitorella]|uniref:Uncharacterized protein n=1 Tax=Cirrhinus molitorella TaxID=172907 RepID=A0ABR3MPI7_9TELE